MPERTLKNIHESVINQWLISLLVSMWDLEVRMQAVAVKKWVPEVRTWVLEARLWVS